MNIVEFLYENKYYLGYTDFDNPGLIHVLQTGNRFCDILRNCFQKNDNIVKTLYSFPKKTILLNTLNESLTWLVPALSEELTLAHVFGFGYTHKNRNLNKKHVTYTHSDLILGEEAQPTKPTAKARRVSPERFYKGDGSTLFAHNACIRMPENVHSVSEEAELVALFFIEKKAKPTLIGYTMGNDLSDPILRRMDRSQFAASKLRPSAIGAELCLGALPSTVTGTVSIKRNDEIVWSANYSTGTSQLLYSLETITRLFIEMAAPIVGNLYYVFLGADKHSFADNFTLKSADTVCIKSDAFVFPLSNQVIIP